MQACQTLGSDKFFSESCVLCQENLSILGQKAHDFTQFVHEQAEVNYASQSAVFVIQVAVALRRTQPD